jgi:hypothetical protein
MALHQVISTDYGVNATYWKIVNIHFNRFDKTIKVTIGGYLDKDSKDNGSHILKTFEYTIDETIIYSENLENNVIQKIYDYVKTLGDFNTAIDC